MRNSPEDCTYGKVCDIFHTNNCGDRLRNCHIDLHDCATYDPPERGITQYRFEVHTSKDGGCVVQYDIYVTEQGEEVKIIYLLELDGNEYWPAYDKPTPFATHSTLKSKL